MDLSEIIKDLNSRVSQKFSNFKGCYLYGSRVKGNYKDDSDLDIVLIFDNELDHKQDLALARIICDTENKYDVFIDYHPFTLEELNINVVFSAEVITKGVYYAAA